MCPSAFTVMWLHITHPVLACCCLVSMSELPITLSLSSGAIISTEQRALIWSVSAHTCASPCNGKTKIDHPYMHRGHEVAYGLLMSPHINLRFNSESPKRRDATTSDLWGGVNSPPHQPSLDRSPSPLPSFPSLLLMSLVRSI